MVEPSKAGTWRDWANHILGRSDDHEARIRKLERNQALQQGRGMVWNWLIPTIVAALVSLMGAFVQWELTR